MKYHIHLDGEIQGPFTRAELEAKNLPPDTLCAAENDTAWDKLGEVLQRPEPLPLYMEGTALGTLVGGVLAALWLGYVLGDANTAATALGRAVSDVFGMLERAADELLQELPLPTYTPTQRVPRFAATPIKF